MPPRCEFSWYCCREHVLVCCCAIPVATYCLLCNRRQNEADPIAAPVNHRITRDLQAEQRDDAKVLKFLVLGSGAEAFVEAFMLHGFARPNCSVDETVVTGDILKESSCNMKGIKMRFIVPSAELVTARVESARRRSRSRLALVLLYYTCTLIGGEIRYSSCKPTTSCVATHVTCHICRVMTGMCDL